MLLDSHVVRFFRRFAVYVVGRVVFGNAAITVRTQSSSSVENGGG